MMGLIRIWKSPLMPAVTTCVTMIAAMFYSGVGDAVSKVLRRNEFGFLLLLFGPILRPGH
jgi:hypothetical protein